MQVNYVEPVNYAVRMVNYGLSVNYAR